MSHKPERIEGTIDYACRCGCGYTGTQAEWMAFHGVDVSAKKESSYSDILRECADIADEREPQYGEAVQNMQAIARMRWHVYGKKMTAEDVVETYIAGKLARDLTKKKPDNILDNINYNAILLKVRKAMEEGLLSEPWA